MIEASQWGHAAGVAPQFGSTPSPRQHRYAEKPEPDHDRWQDRALCKETDPEVFFPEKGGSTREGKKICSGCEVRTDCLEDSLINQDRFGILGGLSERERRKLIKQRREDAA